METAGISQGADGRWYMGGTGRSADGKPVLWAGFVTFASKQEAEAELEAGARALRDDTGRKIRSKKEIDRLVEVACEMHEACNGQRMGAIYWHERDDSGGNWDIRVAHGNDVGPCYDAIYTVVRNLQQAFSIPDER